MTPEVAYGLFKVALAAQRVNLLVYSIKDAGRLWRCALPEQAAPNPGPARPRFA